MSILKKALMLIAGGMLLASCNSSQNISQPVAKKDVKLQFPRQHVSTAADVSFVYDYEQVFTPGQKQKLDLLLRTFEKSNLIAIKLVMLNSASMQTTDFNANNALLFKDWDKAHGSNGKTMVMTVSRSMQKVKTDYGPFVAKLLPEPELAAIIEKNQLATIRDNFFDNTWNALNQIMDAVRKNIK